MLSRKLVVLVVHGFKITVVSATHAYNSLTSCLQTCDTPTVKPVPMHVMRQRVIEGGLKRYCATHA